MHLQLWSWNYAPEPTAMGPVAAAWARAMRDRGHRVEVVSAFPHYPPAAWRQRVRPYRELRDGIEVLRLPLAIGHATTRARVLEELSYAASAAAASALVGRSDVAVVVSPSFLGLAPAVARRRLGGAPWILWLQDILPDAAVTTGLLGNRPALAAARALERAAYRSADRIVVISETFRENLLGKGVPAGKIEVVHNPATRGFRPPREGAKTPRPARVLAMGNIGHSQGLERVVAAFEDGGGPAVATLVVTGSGERAGAVRRAARSDGVVLRGLVADEELDEELDRAALALVTQRPDVAEFNLPSKLMSFMARGLPVLACVRPGAEVARIVAGADAGWVVPSDELDRLVPTLAEALGDEGELRRRAENAYAFAAATFAPAEVARRFEAVAEAVARARPRR